VCVPTSSHRPGAAGTAGQALPAAFAADAVPRLGGWVGVVGRPATPPAPAGQRDPPSVTLCVAGPRFPAPAASPPAAVDSQAPTSSPRAEPEMLLQARLKRTKCSTCKICSVRKLPFLLSSSLPPLPCPICSLGKLPAAGGEARG